MNNQHPPESELLKFAKGELDDTPFEAVAAHVEHCDQCAGVLRKTGAFVSPIAVAKTVDKTREKRHIAERVGSRFGPYKLLQELGEGGMGVVYMAEQEQPVRRMVALKIIKPGMDSSQVIARFEAERQALAMMDHHHIAKVLDAGTTDNGRPYFAMELVKGVPITEYCDRNKLTPRERLEMFVPVCQAIQHAHQKGIIHRDIKPSNVLVTLYDGKPVPKVIDFGIAKATQQKLTQRTMFTGIGQILGTLEYMSPEQAEMNQLDIDTRSDVYSLGVMLYELLTGSTPFTKDQLRSVGLEEMLRTIRETEPPKPSTRLSDSSEALPSISDVRKTEPAKLSKFVRGDLDWIVMKALEKDRTRRYETANGLAMDVQRFLNDESVDACPPSARYKFRKFARRNKKALATGITIAAILVSATGISTSLAIWARRAELIASAKETEANKAAAAEKQARAAEQKQRELAEQNAAQAIREAAKSKEVAAFLTAMLKGVGPSVALGRDTKMLEEILEKTVQRMSTDLANQPEVQAELRTTIGEVYAEFGQFKEAEEQHREALRLLREVHRGAHEDVAALLQQIGGFLRRQGRYEEALELTEASLDMRRSLFGEPHADVASSLASIGRLKQADYSRFGNPDKPRYDAVRESMQRALTEYERSPGDNDLEISDVLRQMGSNAWLSAARKSQTDPNRERRFSEAKSYLNRALAVLRRRDGNDFRKAEANALQILAAVESESGNGAQAEQLAEEAIKVAESIPGSKLTTVNLLYRLGATQENQANFAEASSTYQRMSRAAYEVFGPKAPHALVTHETYAKFLYNMGQQWEAVKLQRDLVTAMSSHRQDASYSTRLWNLGFFLTLGWHDSRHADEAVNLFREVWEIRKDLNGEEKSLGAAVALCNALCLAGRIDEAADIQNQLAYVDGYKDWHHASILNLITGQRSRNDALFERALEGGEKYDDIRAAQAVFFDRNASPEFS